MASERPRSKGRGSYERGWTGLARQVKGQERATVNALLCPLFLFLPTIILPTLLCTPMCLQNHKIPRRNFLCTLHLARRGLRVHKGTGQVGCSGVQVGRTGNGVFEVHLKEGLVPNPCLSALFYCQSQVQWEWSDFPSFVTWCPTNIFSVPTYSSSLNELAFEGKGA